MEILKAGALYFALVFGAGFLLGAIRVPLLVPRFGERTAELMEMPIMFVITIVSARWIVLRITSYNVCYTKLLRRRLPVVLTRLEVQTILMHLHGMKWLAAMLMYGAGLRLLECLRLRVKDIDFGYRQIT